MADATARSADALTWDVAGARDLSRDLSRGSAGITPREQVRASYRNFFCPHQRWQMTGLRLADDA